MRRSRSVNQVDILNNTSFLDALFILIGALVFMLLLVALVTEGLKLGYYDLDMPYEDGAQLPTAIVGRSYDMVVGVYGGNERYSCELVGGQLPAGLEFVSQEDLDTPGAGTCRITGTPTVPTNGSVSITLRADDTPVTVEETGEVLDKEPVTRELKLSVIKQSQASPLVLRMDSVPQAIRNTGYRLFLAVEGGVAPYQWTMTGRLPEGLSLDPSGVLEGIPSSQGNTQLQFRVRDATSAEMQTSPITLGVAREFPRDLTVPPLRIKTTAAPTATAGEKYVLYLSAVGGLAPYRWEVVGNIPSGFECCRNGALTGIPDSEGKHSLVLRVHSSSNSIIAVESTEQRLALKIKSRPPVKLPLKMF